MRSVKAPYPVELWALSAITLVGVFLVSPGFVTIDEAIHYLGSRALAENGTLGLTNNGFDQFRSESLKLRYLVDGPQGLTPQYPAGSALLTAPLLPFLGPRAFVLLNALAAAAMLFTVRKICLRHFKNETVARIAIALLICGTFWAEYALGQWPHMVSAFFALQSYWFLLRYLDSNAQDDRYAALSGLFAGLGMLFRLDAFLAVPAIGLILLIFAPRFIRSSAWFGVGVVPSLALMSCLNYLKFGSPNPLSYGQQGGNTDLTSYVALFAALCVGFGALALWRLVGRRFDRRLAVGSVAVLVVALLVIPATNVFLLRVWNGFLALVVDARNIEHHRFGVERGPANTLIAWGQVKKSLGQSMPWIGIVAILLTSGVQKEDRRTFTMLFIFVTTMTMPFILLSWHGGGGSNMRYFLPVLPALCILCAKLISDLWSSVPKGMTFVVAGVWAAVGLCFAWAMLHPSRFTGVQQIVATYVLLATALAAIAAGIDWRIRPAARGLSIVMLSTGFIMSMSFALSDFGKAAQRRTSNHNGSLMLADLPPQSLVIAYPDWVGDRMPGNGSILAVRDELTRATDQQLMLNALDAGYRVFMVSYELDPKRDVPAGVELFATGYASPAGRIIELRRGAGQPTTLTKTLVRPLRPSG